MKKLTVTAFLSLCSIRLFAATLFVAPTGADDNSGASWALAKQTLQAAIEVAVTGDAIVVTNGTYAPIITDNRAITITSIEGAKATIIDGGGTNCCANLGSGTSDSLTLLEGFTLQNGNAVTGGGAFYGILKKCVISNNTAVFGGGTYYATLTNCEITQNRAEFGAGAYYGYFLNCSLTDNTANSQGGAAYGGTFTDCTIQGNVATNSGGGTSRATLTNCTINRNSAANGGGVDYSDLMGCVLIANSANHAGGGAHGDSTLRNCTISANYADDGGGVYGGLVENCVISGNLALLGGGSAGGAKLYNCTLNHNRASHGGGSHATTLYNCLIKNNVAEDHYGGTYDTLLYNCVVSGNSAAYYVGGCGGGTLVNCTISGNVAEVAGGTADATLLNSIVWGNRAGTANDNVYQHGTVSYAYTLSDEELPGEGNIAGDPLFVDAANDNFHLRGRSPAIDAGSKELIYAEFDLDGNPRILGAAIDMGAYEGVATPYLSDPNLLDAPPLTMAATFDGFVFDGSAVIHGTLTLKAKPTAKKSTDRTTKVATFTTNWTITAKVTIPNGNFSFSRKLISSLSGEIILATKGHERMSLILEANTLRGTLYGGKVGGDFYVNGSRAIFLDKKDAVAQHSLSGVKGLYNVALVNNAHQCLGYLSINVSNGGKVKLAGKLADNTSVSAGVKLLSGLNEDGWYAISLYKPLYTKRGSIGGLLWLNPDDEIIRVDSAQGWFINWRSIDPRKEPFSRNLIAIGGSYSGLGGSRLVFSADVPTDLPPPVIDLPGEWITAAFPNFLAVTLTGTKLSLPKATKPQKVGTGSAMHYDYHSENPSGAKLNFSNKTGSFKGSFKLYYDGFNNRDALQHKAANVSYMGLVTPTRDASFADAALGLGFGTTTINRQREAIAVFLDKLEATP